MDLTFKIKYSNGSKKFDGLDMYYGSHSLAAISEILLLSLHAGIHGEVVIQAPAAKGFRLVLKKSQEGSLEQLIQLLVTDPDTVELLADLTKDGIYDVLKFLVSSCLGIPFVIKNRKAKRRIQQLMRANEDLHGRLERAFAQAHLPVKHQGLSVCLSMGRTAIITLDDETLNYLETEVVETDSEIIRVGVSRFNARTGTGRFITDIDSISHSFSPSIDLNDYQKTIMADNLGKVARGEFEPLNALVCRINSTNGRLKRYQLQGISDA
ncbi:hypothetical protein VC218_13380 [Xanthomonas nasturtii]|uniref:DUF7946 domain-containing protein n=1 Tax=Xanthomonas nasturtii TaxID=1843581 RepID=UPI002B22BECA|nr:hypothetical protein [Xanthomonas nasturtii]MEA9579853.1 hypothetical protein [Xanthomonas nasturtii]